MLKKMPTPPRARSGGISDPALSRYFADLASCPLLPPDEERRLAIRAARGDLDARRRLAAGSLRLVVSVARSYTGYGLPLADMVQEGNVGLLEAVRRFDPGRGKLSSYAIHWIRAYVVAYVLANWGIVKVASGRDGRRLFFGLRRERARLEAAGAMADSSALAEALDVDEGSVDGAEARFSPASVLEPDDMAMADERADPEDAAQRADLARAVRARVAAVEPDLDDRERTILSCRLLAPDGEPETMDSIGRRYGVSRQRIEQIERGLRRRLRARLADVAAPAA